MNASPFRSQVVEATSEVARIAALPRRTWSPEAALELAALLTRELKTPGGTMKLRPVQAIALYEAMEVGGLFGPMRVGAGKTLCTALLPAVLEAKRPILLLPAALIDKTAVEFKVLREHWRIATNLQLISYESLGLVQSANKFAYIQPDLIVADEAHYLKNHRAGRTRRVARYMQERPDTRFVAVSGTVMKGSVRDFAHLLRWALKAGAPIPATDEEVESWADALDDRVNPLSRRQPAALLELGEVAAPADRGRELAQLLADEQASDLTRARRAFQARLLETRGVVASPRSDGVTCSLRVSALEYQPSAVTEQHFDTLRRRSETPCGKSFTEATEMQMYARELALGFSYTWIPREKVAEWDALVLQSKNVGWLKTGNDGGKPTLRSAGRTLGLGTPGTGQLSLKELLRGTTATGERSTSSSTDSPSSSTKRLSKNTEVDVTSAKEKSERGPISRSTIVIKQAESEVFFARNAIEASGCLGTMPLGLNEPLRTFLTQNSPPPDWLAARKAWCSFVREQIEQSYLYDTMLQVANACRAGSLSSRTLDAWKEIESSYEPLTRPIFYDTTALETCVAWMQEHVGVVWVEHQAFGVALSQLSGVPYYGAGGYAQGVSIMDVRPDKSIIASVQANGTGRNLQMFSANLVTSCPSSAAIVEQLIGRTHRDGQEADTVTVDVLFGCREHYDAITRAIDGARAAADVLGHDQKLLLADLILPNIDNRKGPLWA
jgi:hypothetical protein